MNNANNANVAASTQPRTWLQRLLTMQKRYSDLLEQQRALNLWRITLLVITLLVAELVLINVFGTMEGVNRLYFSVEIVVAVVALVAVMALLNRGELIAACLLFVIDLYIGVTFRQLTFPTHSFLVGFTIPIVAAGVLINRRGMAVMSGLVIVTIVLNSLFSQVGLLPPFATAPLVNATITAMLSVAVDAVMLVIFAGGQRALLTRNIVLNNELRDSTTLASALGDVRSVDELLQHAVEIVRDRLNYYHVQIFLYEPVSGLLVLRAGTTLTLTQPDGRSRRIEPGHPGVISDAATNGKLQIITANDPQSRRSELLPGMQFEAVLPLHSEDAILGVLDVQSPDAQVLGGQAIEVLQAVATPLALALNSLRMSEEVKALTADRQRFSDQLKIASREIERLNREVSERSWSTYLEGRGTEAIGYDWSPKGIVANTLPFPGLERGLNSVLPELFLDQNEHVLSVPVVSRGQVLGAMEFRAGEGRVWTERSIELARLIAQRLALALDNIRLYEQAQGLARREQVASQVSAQLQSRTDVDSLVSEAAEMFRQALGATRTQVRLGTPETTPKARPGSGTGLTGLLETPEKRDNQNGGQAR